MVGVWREVEDVTSARLFYLADSHMLRNISGMGVGLKLLRSMLTLGSFRRHIGRTPHLDARSGVVKLLPARDTSV